MSKCMMLDKLFMILESFVNFKSKHSRKHFKIHIEHIEPISSTVFIKFQMVVLQSDFSVTCLKSLYHSFPTSTWRGYS